jgi:hypothetical protein
MVWMEAADIAGILPLTWSQANYTVTLATRIDAAGEATQSAKFW